MDKVFSALAGMDNAKGFFLYARGPSSGMPNSYSAGRGQNNLAGTRPRRSSLAKNYSSTVQLDGRIPILDSFDYVI